MTKLYGTSMSRAVRSLWALEEAGVEYEHVPVGFTGETRKPEYLKINPNGHMPALDDNGTTLWESMAINLYIAEKYGKAPLWPATVEGQVGVSCKRSMTFGYFLRRDSSGRHEQFRFRSNTY
jgi:glutathione S-transferase